MDDDSLPPNLSALAVCQYDSGSEAAVQWATMVTDLSANAKLNVDFTMYGAVDYDNL